MRYFLIIALAILVCMSFIFRPKTVTYEENPKVKLIGTSWKEDGAIAIINGEILRENESISGYKVLEIEKGYVILSRNDQDFKLTFSGLSKRNLQDITKDRVQQILSNLRERCNWGEK